MNFIQAKTATKSSQEKAKAAINSIRDELEEIVKNREEDALTFVGQQTQGLREEGDASIGETQRDLENSLRTRTRSFQDETVYAKRDLCDEMADTKRTIMRSLTS
jgi:uncharacterized radical SAM superfamily Fe-S cluster-containing enzyme